MSCSTGCAHTVCLDDQGNVHAFGDNDYGQLGLGHIEIKLIPTQVPSLSCITQVSCGSFFTACVDDQGLLWTFGENDHGQLGIGNTNRCESPHKVNISPVQNVSCGFEHVMVNTQDFNLWTFGRNSTGELCLGHKQDGIFAPENTLFTNILTIAAGSHHSLFQNIEGEIYGCGNNENGELGLGNNETEQIQVILLPNQPGNIIQFCCGSLQSFFLDSDGNIFYTGFNMSDFKNLGKNTICQIQNVPTMKLISCINTSCFTLDDCGNVWVFGHSIGRDNDTLITIPQIIENLTDIQCIPTRCFIGNHLLAKDSQNKVFVLGDNLYGELGTGNKKPCFPAREMNFSNIWGTFQTTSKVKSARK